MGLLSIFLIVLVLIVGVKYYTAQVLLRQQRLLNEATERLQEARGWIKLATNNLLVERRRESECYRVIERLNRDIAGLEEEIWKAEQAERVEGGAGKAETRRPARGGRIGPDTGRTTASLQKPSQTQKPAPGRALTFAYL